MKIESSDLMLGGKHALEQSHDIQIDRKTQRIKGPHPFERVLDRELNADPPEGLDRRTQQAREKAVALGFVQSLLERLISASDEDGTSPSCMCQCKDMLRQIERAERNPKMITETTIKRTYSRSETTSFSAQGSINTADGCEITVDLNMTMSHSYSETLEIHQKQVHFLDPLMIHYQGPAQDLDPMGHQIDLNLDGILDELLFPDPGSGFITIDKNGNGEIDDGSEMLGPETGRGIDELKQYDEDGNGWIDENDAIYQQLRIWHQDEQGEKHLSTLSELDVGAIYLGAAETPFTKYDAANNVLAQIRRSGIFLREDGSQGTIQEVDYKL